MARLPKNEWQSTKFEMHKGRWRAGPSVALSSRLVVDLQLQGYEAALTKFARGRLIDLGCGNAPLRGIYADLVDEYVWADWDSQGHILFELDYVVDLNRELPFAEAQFDTIVLSDVLEHIASPERLFAEVARILRPGGHLIVGVPFLYWIHEPPHDHHRYTKYKLAHFGATHGLDVVEIKETGGAFDVWSDLTGKLLGVVWGPLAVVPYLSWLAAKKLRFVRRLNDRASGKFPLAYIAVYKRP